MRILAPTGITRCIESNDTKVRYRDALQKMFSTLTNHVKWQGEEAGSAGLRGEAAGQVGGERGEERPSSSRLGRRE